MKNLRAILALFSLMMAVPASAHLLPKSQGTINLTPQDAYTMVSLPASALQGVDDDGDGRISGAEMERHRDAILRQVADGLIVGDRANPRPESEAQVMLPDEDGTPSATILVLQHTHFAAPVAAPFVATRLFGSSPADRQLVLTVAHGADREVAILTPDAPRRRLLVSLPEALADFIRIGVLHILTGPDHLLFLLTIVTAASGWRYWLRVISSFTIAHSITLTLAAEDIIRVRSAITEPAIAASIVLMAGLALWQRRSQSQSVETRRRGGWTRIGAVFACGLLHGMGFASALGDMALDGRHKIASLVGFNLGVELGQGLFLLSVAAIAALAHRLLLPALAARPARALPALAGLAGLVMFVQRVAGG